MKGSSQIMAHVPKRSRNDQPECAGRRRPILMTVTSAALVASITTGVGAGMAQAAPEQGGTSPSDTAPQQGGTTPASPSTGTPEQGGTTPTPEPVPVEPVYTPGPGSIPGPPQEAPYQPYVAPSVYTAPTYEDDYEVTPIQTLNAPRPAAPVRPIAPPPEKIRVGNFITDIPEGMSDKDVNSINAWAAYGEAKIAQGLISMGVPADEASRQAASTIIGVVGGATAGAGAGALMAAPMGIVPGVVVGVPVGAAIGAVYNGVTFSWMNAAPGFGTVAWANMIGLGALAGAGIGLLAGPVVGAGLFGAAGAIAGAVAGGTAGGALAYALGAGDPGANPEDPWKQGEAEPMPNPDANQFQVNLPAEEAKQVGLPAANYTVNVRGDVSVQVGDMKTGWTAEQAQAPYNALGALAGSQVENAARTFVKDNAPKLENLIPGVKVSWPQEIAPVS